MSAIVSTPAKAAPPTAIVTVMRTLGAGLLFATGGYHLDLYLTGFRFIPTIGRLFVLQVVIAFALGFAVLATPSKVRFRGFSLQQLVAGGSALFAIGTLAGYLVTLFHGMFGFKDIRSTQGVVAGIIEITAFLALGWVATADTRRPSTRGLVGAVAVVFAVLLVVGEVTQSITTRPSGSTAAGGHEITIVIKDFAFQPDDPTVTPGERILVKNDDGVAHTFSSLPGTPAASAFTTGAIGPGSERTLDAPKTTSTIKFECLIHTFMRGTLTVKAPAG